MAFKLTVIGKRAELHNKENISNLAIIEFICNTQQYPFWEFVESFFNIMQKIFHLLDKSILVVYSSVKNQNKCGD